MARNAAALVNQVLVVLKEPAVQKAAHQTWVDFSQAGKSAGDLAQETRVAWRRSGGR